MWDLVVSVPDHCIYFSFAVQCPNIAGTFYGQRLPRALLNIWPVNMKLLRSV